MPKTITVMIEEPYLKVLEQWASVGRTLRTAESCCNDAGQTLDDNTIEKYRYCSEELQALIPALEYLHHTVRGKLWEVK